MSVVELSHIVKSFGPVKAVEDVSFSLEKGELFGLLGPNGAGKTTSLRVMLDIFKPDHGSVALLGGPMSEAKKDRIGYMPEERGLYQDVPLERCLLYLGSLKGMSPADGKRHVDEFLERFDLAEHKNKKVKELSKGMQQKAQVAATLLHQPELLIVDEPFSGFDPINTQVIKEVLLEQHAQGVTIILCSHQMHQVDRPDGKPALTARFYDVDGNVKFEDVVTALTAAGCPPLSFAFPRIRQPPATWVSSAGSAMVNRVDTLESTTARSCIPVLVGRAILRGTDR